MIEINGKPYVTVHERILKAHEEKETVEIYTEITTMDDHSVTVKAVVKIDGHTYTGHAQEVFGSNFINKSSALENAETSAVGRALAFAGFGIEESIASADEIINALQSPNFPEPKNGKGKQRGQRFPSPNSQATMEQIRKLERLLENPLVNDKERARLQEVLSGSDLNYISANSILDHFYGKGEYRNGHWERKTAGVLAERRIQQAS